MRKYEIVFKYIKGKTYLEFSYLTLQRINVNNSTIQRNCVNRLTIILFYGFIHQWLSGCNLIHLILSVKEIAILI
jgi:hypothetical protein